MTDRYRASPLSVRFSQEDREWLTNLAQDEDVSIHALVSRAVQYFRYWQEEGEKALNEALEIFEAERRAHEDERRLRLYYQRDYELQSRRLHSMLRDERHRRWEQEKQLSDERKLRAEYEKQLHDERDLRAVSEKRIRYEHDYYERHARTTGEYQNVSYGPTIAKLLTLALRSESDAEAMAAFAKARTLHRQKQHPRSGTR